MALADVTFAWTHHSLPVGVTVADRPLVVVAGAVVVAAAAVVVVVVLAAVVVVVAAAEVVVTLATGALPARSALTPATHTLPASFMPVLPGQATPQWRSASP